MVTGNSPQRARSILPRQIYLAAFCMLIVLLGGWCWNSINESTKAEANLHSGRVVAQMIEAYVEKTCRWPQSWADLESFRLKRFQEGDLWAREMQQLTERVDVRFDFVDGLPTDDDFHRQPPVQPHTPYYRAPFEVRLEQLHLAVKRCTNK